MSEQEPKVKQTFEELFPEQARVLEETDARLWGERVDERIVNLANARMKATGSTFRDAVAEVLRDRPKLAQRWALMGAQDVTPEA
jgi:hypothetical protein